MRFWYFAVSAGLLVLLVLAIQKKWRNQLSAKARYALWILPMIRLLIPFGMAELPEGNVMSLPYAVFEYTVNAFRDGDMAGQAGEIPAGSASGERSQDAETSGAGGAAFPAGPEEDIQTDRETHVRAGNRVKCRAAAAGRNPGGNILGLHGVGSPVGVRQCDFGSICIPE